MSVLILVIAVMLAITSISIKKTVPAVLAFILMMFLLGIYYIIMDEKLLGLFQIFVYTGGIVVLVLFGITVIGSEFPEPKGKQWSAFGIVLVAVGLFIVPFLLPEMPHKAMGNQVKVFTDNYAEVTIFLAIVGASILYGSIRMLHTLTREEDANV